MRPDSPPPLTLTEHVQLGREIRTARARLREMCSLVVEIYGSDNRAAEAFLQVMGSLEKLCSDLEVQAAEDHPGYKVDGYYT